MGAFHEVRTRTASACHARRVGRFGSDSKRTAAAASDIAAANVNRQHLQPRLRFGRYVLLEFVCGARQCHRAGQSAMQSQLHYVAARLQATMLRVPRSKPVLHGVAQAGRPIGCDASDEETPAVGGGRGWVLETGCRRVSRRFDPARRWLAIGKDGVRQAPATVRQASRLR
jgi:hypothetical protein